jgi:xylose dehydrogenase (NAD/NADP)
VSESVLRWGILGPGRIAGRLAPAIAGSARGRLAAVASRDISRAEAFAADHDVPTVYPTYQALLDAPDIDVVYVAVPNALHADWTIRALEAGKHVLCEKPLALTVAEVDAIIDAARRTGRVAVEAFMYLHHPQIERAMEIVRDGSLGRLELVNGTFSFFLDRAVDPRIDPAMGGGSLWDVGCYPVSLARFVAGEEPDRVGAFARFDEQEVDRTFIGQMHFPSGLLAQFDSGFSAPDRERVEIVGSDATLELDTPWKPAPDGAEPTLVIWRDRTPTSIPVDSIDQYRAEVEDLEAAVLDGTPPRIDLAFSRGSIATLVELDRAARANAGLSPR